MNTDESKNSDHVVYLEYSRYSIKMSLKSLTDKEHFLIHVYVVINVIPAGGLVLLCAKGSSCAAII